MPEKLKAGDIFPRINVSTLDGSETELGAASDPSNWKLIIVYRGKHCPICTRYLQELEDHVSDFKRLGVEVIAVSADSQERAKTQTSPVNPSYPVAFDLTIDQMQALGLYISGTRNGIDVEHPFAEPGLFVVNNQGQLQMVDVSNVPFLRPEISAIYKGLKFIRGRTENFPINGTYAA